MLWREGRGESAGALTGILWVVRNRMADPAHRWPRTISQVILQPEQFSSFNPGSADAKFPIEDGSADWLAWAKCQDVVTAPLGGDPTGGANSYTSEPPLSSPEKWDTPERLTTKIGPFYFYRV
jgi:spore germination cell wall hydrolase CwlJ-like protein